MNRLMELISKSKLIRLDENTEIKSKAFRKCTPTINNKRAAVLSPSMLIAMRWDFMRKTVLTT